MSRVFFVNRFYWPEEPATAQLLTDLAPALAAAGHDVTVITSRPGRAEIPFEETHRGVRIVRVRGSRLGKTSLLRRALDFATFLRGARRLVSTLSAPGETLVAMTDPPLLGTALAGIARRKNLRLVHWIQDIFPEVAMTLGHGFTAIFRSARDRAWQRADACVTLGIDMAGLVRARGVAPKKIHIIPNWAPADLVAGDSTALRAAWGLQGKFVVAYSGNLGRVHDFSAIVPLAEALRSDPDIALVFVGDGAQRPALEAAVRARRLGNVHFHPPQPRAQLGATLALGDVHLVTLRADCTRLVFPSKLYGIAAVGRPVIFLGPPDCEVAQVVTRGNFGYAFSGADVSASAAAIRALRDDLGRRAALGRAASDFCDREATLARAVARWGALLDGKPLAPGSPASSVSRYTP